MITYLFVILGCIVAPSAEAADTISYNRDVRTSDDFGSQGELPSHPELLDWLAGEFVRNGWDVQHILRLILSSATYGQTSRLTPELQAADPTNRLLARGPRFRINAEFVRDQALSVAGLLSQRVGGKSVKPYHPPGLYELVTAGSSTNTWVQDQGESWYRRSMYSNAMGRSRKNRELMRPIACWLVV